MTAIMLHFNLFILFICTCFPKTSLDRRFSDLKRCADDECSMLLCRGKASEDFTGPDCRFLSFKKGETIYVYYKLSGQRSDVWAGSVGNNFGYFPKDFLNINHIYTEKEIEVRAEETDFVCFDTGLDKFESYDIDMLLRSSLINEADDPINKTVEMDAAEDRETEETVNSDSLHTKSEAEHEVDIEDAGDLHDSETVQLLLETIASYESDKDSYVVSDTGEGVEESVDGDSDLEHAINKDIPDEPSSKDVEKSDHTTPVEAISELKTTLGTTFDAVTSDDERTKKVTPYDDADDDDEAQRNDLVEQPNEVEEERMREPSLLTFEEKPRYFEDNVPDANESEDKHISFQKEETSLSEEDAENRETEETVNSDLLHTENEAEHEVDTEDPSDLQDSESTRLPLKTTASYEMDKGSYGVKETADGDSDLEQATNKDMPDEPSPKDGGVLEKSDHTTPVEAISKLKTTLGTTFDAVTSDDERTKKVTPYNDDDEEAESNDLVEQPSEVEEERMREPSLLTFEEKPRYFEDNVPDANESKDKHVSFQKEETSLSEEDAENREMEETINSDVLRTENEAVHEADTEDPSDLRDSQATRLPLKTTASYETGKGSYSVKETADGDSDLEQATNKDTPDEPSPKDGGVLEKSDHTTPVEAISVIKTTLGTTFDAVTSDDEHTEKVTPYNDDEAESNDLVEQPSEVEEERMKEPSLLTFEEKPRYFEDNVPDANESKDKDVPFQPSASVEAKKDDSMWSTLGDTVFKIVSGGKRTDLPEDNSDDNDDDEDDLHAKTTDKDADERQTSLVHDSETSEVADEMKSSINDPVINSLNDDNNYAEVQDENANVLKYDEELEEIKGKSSDQDDTLVDAVESESDPPSSSLEDVKPVLDKPIKSFGEKNILKPIPSEIDSHKSEALFEEGVHSVPQLEEQTDEQIDRVKREIIDLFEDALKTEKSDPNIDEEREELEELLEDENAILSAKTKLAEELEESIENTNLESQLEKNELAMPKQPHENSPGQANKTEQISHDGKTVMLDISDSLPNDKKDDGKSVDSNSADSGLRKVPEYSDSVLRLTLLRDRFKDDKMERILRHLTIKDLYRVEAMFTELDLQLKSAMQSYSQDSEGLERTLASIVEVSENAILDEIDKMLDTREQRVRDLGQKIDPLMTDEETAVFDDFQEFVFDLHQKYSISVPVVKENKSDFEKENVSEEVENPVESISLTKVAETPEVHQESSELLNVNGQEGESQSQDLSPGEDSGHFNKNENNQAAVQDKTEIQRGLQASLENPLDILGFEIEPSSDSVESSRASDVSDNNNGQASTSASDQSWDFFLLASEFLSVYTEILIAALPEEWQPGPTFHGLPWKPVVATAVVGVVTVLVFIWRTVLAVKNRIYILTEKQLAERIRQLVSEKSDVLQKVTELNNAIKEYEEKLNNSEESRCSLQKEFHELKTQYRDLNNQKEKLHVNFAHLCEKIENAQQENKTLNEKISTMHQGIKKYQKTLKEYDEERSKVQILVDEAKLREDALKAQVLSFEKDNCALKGQKKSLLQDAKDWQEKHEKLSEEIKVYHKTQTELENALVHKENEIDVLSGCIAELKSLEACNDAQVENDKNENSDPLKLHLKQMMDVSKIKATLSVIEDERNRWFENFMAEQKARQELEEKFQKVIHDQTNLKNEKTHLENQYKNLQQRLEITTELYHQKENILHQKLTQEELERHEKETKLSEVDGRALQAEEELNCLRQKVKDMQEEMQQNERSLKAEIAVQEKKAHENWLKARASERALIEERRECANLRQKIVECSDKMSDLEHALYKSGPPDRHMAPLQRGDSYGPSPVSGGAPSPPLMIEDPGRPPSGPVGRRSEPFGPRILLDGLGRSTDLGHPLPFRPELSGPRTSSPCTTQDGAQMAPIDAKAEVTMQASTDPTEAISKSQRPGQFLPSPIRESPVPASNAHPKAYGPQPMGGPLPPVNGPLPPVMRPPNGHSPMIPPGPPFGPDTCFRPPHMDSYRPPFPLRPYGPIPPPFVHGPPLRDFPSLGPHPPPHGIHDFPPNFAGPQDLPFAPRTFPSGPLPPPGAMVPPAVGVHGPAPPTPLQPRDRQEVPHVSDVPPEQRVTQNAPTPAVTQS
ncbi:transport and Golgi organization protein 1 homolog isoform X2 [Neoarius graeffei]|uniref:transport and Golgi organization protein 1 homolog isoform X2 n=1 Tax=Neoarius graeffei TaxID=443677 RepID=UPI00298C2D93|nr:transport and Golgi organization protein 1 homolog isoform X2 [Neoarius graeffei]